MTVIPVLILILFFCSLSQELMLNCTNYVTTVNASHFKLQKAMCDPGSIFMQPRASVMTHILFPNQKPKRRFAFMCECMLFTQSCNNPIIGAKTEMNSSVSVTPNKKTCWKLIIKKDLHVHPFLSSISEEETSPSSCSFASDSTTTSYLYTISRVLIQKDYSSDFFFSDTITIPNQLIDLGYISYGRKLVVWDPVALNRTIKGEDYLSTDSITFNISAIGNQFIWSSEHSLLSITNHSFEFLGPHPFEQACFLRYSPGIFILITDMLELHEYPTNDLWKVLKTNLSLCLSQNKNQIPVIVGNTSALTLDNIPVQAGFFLLASEILKKIDKLDQKFEKLCSLVMSSVSEEKSINHLAIYMPRDIRSWVSCATGCKLYRCEEEYLSEKQYTQILFNTRTYFARDQEMTETLREQIKKNEICFLVTGNILVKCGQLDQLDPDTFDYMHTISNNSDLLNSFVLKTVLNSNSSLLDYLSNGNLPSLQGKIAYLQNLVKTGSLIDFQGIMTYIPPEKTPEGPITTWVKNTMNAIDDWIYDRFGPIWGAIMKFLFWSVMFLVFCKLVWCAISPLTRIEKCCIRICEKEVTDLMEEKEVRELTRIKSHSLNHRRNLAHLRKQ